MDARFDRLSQTLVVVVSSSRCAGTARQALPGTARQAPARLLPRRNHCPLLKPEASRVVAGACAVSMITGRDYL